MADNVTITQGAGSTPPDGTVVATDDVAGVQYQRVKLDVGADGASTPVVGTLPVSGTVTANAGTGPWPITDNGGSLTVDGTVAVSGNVAVTAAALPLPTGAATDTLQTAEAVLIGAVAESAPASDTGSSGLNGRLQRIAQRLTSLIALLPASLGQKASTASLAVVVASDQSAIPASQSGTWTVQPGNTANTTAWKVDGSAVIQPVSGTVTANQGTIADTAPATQNITAQDVASTTTVVANGQSLITGSATAGSTASFALASGFDTVRFLVTGTWTGTLSVEVSMDGGTTWTTQGIHQTGTAYAAAALTANFAGHANAAGFTHVRIRSTAAWTGTATVRVVQSVNPASVYLHNAVRLQDATTQSTQNTIKAASTAALATDTALVVAISPNNTVAATQSGTWTVTQASAATDGSASEPSTDLTAGWDGLNVRSLFVQALDGRNTLFVHDPTSRRLVEQLVIESRLTNVLLARLLGPQAPTQRELEPGTGLMN